METSRFFMSLLAELDGLADGFCYKHVAAKGAPALRRRLFNNVAGISLKDFPKARNLESRATELGFCL